MLFSLSLCSLLHAKVVWIKLTAITLTPWTSLFVENCHDSQSGTNSHTICKNSASADVTAGRFSILMRLSQENNQRIFTAVNYTAVFTFLYWLEATSGQSTERLYIMCFFPHHAPLHNVFIPIIKRFKGELFLQILCSQDVEHLLRLSMIITPVVTFYSFWTWESAKMKSEIWQLWDVSDCQTGCISSWFFFLKIFISSSCSSPFCRWHPLLLRLCYEPMWQEGADVAEQRVCCLRPGPVGHRREHRLLALPGGGHHPSCQPDHRHPHVPPLRPLEGVFLGW